MATPFLKPACIPPRREVRRPFVECGAYLLCPIVPLIYADYASSASAQMVQHGQPPAGNIGCGIGTSVRRALVAMRPPGCCCRQSDSHATENHALLRVAGNTPW